MNYIGSKHSLLGFLENSIKQIVGEVKDLVFCDLFAGTGAVGLHFKKLECRVIANDIQYYSFVLSRHHIGNHKEIEFKDLGIKDVCEYLNDLEGFDGFISKNYSPNKNSERMYFTKENAKKCDAIRMQIEKWYADKKINEDEYFFLLTSLLESIDKRANTASVYGAYLKEFKKSARKPMEFLKAPIYVNDYDHKIFNKDANELIKEIEADILYLDPPYNARQYCTNYHLLETIAKYDEPTIAGKTGLRKGESKKSKYCSKATVKNEFKELIQNAKAKYIFLSYNNEGLLSFEDIKEVMSEFGTYGHFEQEYNRFKADSKRKQKADKTIEYLHYLIKESV